jgi:hypothetical protein
MENEKIKDQKKSTEENIEAASHCAHFYCLVCFSFIFLFNSFECERITSHKILYYIITFVITQKKSINIIEWKKNLFPGELNKIKKFLSVAQ